MSDERFNEGGEGLEVSGDVAAALGAMSRWEGEVGVWKAAVGAPAASPFRRTRRLPTWVTALAAMLVFAGLIGIMLPLLGKSRASARVARPSSAAAPEVFKRVPASDQSFLAGFSSVPAAVTPQRELEQASSERSSAGMPLLQRSVIRKATIELKTPDVRAAFAKAAQVLSEASGEYVQESSLTGEDKSLQATMTLRVEASRLSAVLNQLRAMGAVVSETSGGEDVTEQVVDIEARLHNEQRVEAELLGLMESRKDAPLKEILELRDSISRVRENIERMSGQQAKLSRLVSLATVLVIIRSDLSEPEPLPQGIADYFGKQVQRAWQGGLGFLADSVAFIISVVVGGLVFWLLGAVVVLGAVLARKRALARRGTETAPRL